MMFYIRIQTEFETLNPTNVPMYVNVTDFSFAFSLG